MQGWISLHRKIQCHPFYKERRKFSKFEAWIDLLLEANHTDKDWIVGNEVIPVKRGSFITSEIQLMERWQWSKSKVRAYLILLQSENMIIKKSDTKKTTISIVNYDNYQDNGTTKKPKKDCKKTAKELQKDTTNNVNNDNNVNKKDIDQFFESIWKEYPRKIGKGQVSDKKKKELYLYGYGVIKKCIERYKNDKKVWQEWKHGSTFFNSGYIDYLDENYSPEKVISDIPNYTGATDDELYGGM